MASVFAAECLPGNMQTYMTAATPCTLGAVSFSNFDMQLEGIDPSLIGVNPGGTASMPSFTFTLNGLTDVSIHFRAASPLLSGYGLDITGASVTGPAGVIAQLSVCADGAFAGPGPVDCDSTPGAALVYHIESFPQTADFVNVPAGVYDAYFELFADTANGGTASLPSATAIVSTAGPASVPEPSSMWLLCAPASAAVALRRRIRRA
jgi:hypothetical protein